LGALLDCAFARASTSVCSHGVPPHRFSQRFNIPAANEFRDGNYRSGQKGRDNEADATVGACSRRNSSLQRGLIRRKSTLCKSTQMASIIELIKPEVAFDPETIAMLLGGPRGGLGSAGSLRQRRYPARLCSRDAGGDGAAHHRYGATWYPGPRRACQRRISVSCRDIDLTRSLGKLLRKRLSCSIPSLPGATTEQISPSP
jgi:hypothetical protein